MDQIIKTKPNIIKFPIEQLNKENGIIETFSHPAFCRKLLSDIKHLCDVSLKEKKLEFEMKSGNRYWFDFSDFFGKFIFNVENIFIQYQNEILHNMQIIDVEVYKIKRTNYIKLLFQKDLPF